MQAQLKASFGHYEIRSLLGSGGMGVWKDADKDMPALVEARKEYEQVT